MEKIIVRCQFVNTSRTEIRRKYFTKYFYLIFKNDNRFKRGWNRIPIQNKMNCFTFTQSVRNEIEQVKLRNGENFQFI